MTFTVPVLDAFTSAVGEEITLLAGYRLTRLTAPFLGEQPVSTGINSATGTSGGTTITLSSGTFGTALVGQLFRVTSGPCNGKTGIISNVVSPTQITIAPGVGDISSASWQVVVPAQTTMYVESALDFDAAGSVIVDGINYSYTSRTNSSLIGVSRADYTRPRGGIQTPAGSAIPDGAQLVLNDGYGAEIKLEFTKDGSVSAGFIGVAISNGMTAAQVRDALFDRLTTFEDLRIDFFKVETATIDLWHHETGTQGNIAMTLSPAVAGFVVDGLRGGTVTASGAAQDHTTATQVVEYTRNYSSLDKFRRGFFLNTATGTDLDNVGLNVGVARPDRLVDDTVYRNIIAALAYKPRGTIATLENFLNAAFGVGGWEYFEDFTANFDSTNNEFPAPNTTSRYPGVVFIRRNNNSEATSIGKAYVVGSKLLIASGATTVTLPADSLLPYRLIPAADRSWQLVATGTVAAGTGATTTSPSSVTSPASAFPDRIKRGDILELTSGPKAGTRAVIYTRNSATSLTLGGAPGVEHSIFPFNSLTTAADWQIYRPASNFRNAIPSTEKFLENAIQTTPWVYGQVGGLIETTQVTVVADDYTMLNPGSTQNDHVYYSHLTRIYPESYVSFEILSRLNGNPDNTNTHLKQWYFSIFDGAYEITVGMHHHATHVEVGFLDAAGTAFIAGGIQITIPHNANMNFASFRIEKRGTSQVLFYANGQLIDTKAYSAFTGASPNRELRFGTIMQSNNAAKVPHLHIKSAQWLCETPTLDFLNVRQSGGTTTAPNQLDAASASFVMTTDIGRRVRINSFTNRLTARGTPLGEWEIATTPSTTQVTLIGPTREHLSSIGTQYPKQLIVDHDPTAFVWPDHLGHQIQILSGPNAGTYAISKILNPVDRTDYSVTQPRTLTSALIPARQYSNLIEVSTNLPAPADDSVVNWRLVPAFVSDSGIGFEIINATSIAGSTLTLRTTLPHSTELLELKYANVPSASVPRLADNNVELSPGNYSLYPFYLWDNWGWIRDYLDVVRPAGVQVDLDRLYRDAAGLHIR